MLPILHLNGYKIANPTILARITREELDMFLRGCGWAPTFVEGHEPALMHQAMASALDGAVEAIKKIQHGARDGSLPEADVERPRWPMIVLISPKGWTGPKWVDGLQSEGTFRAHQVPIAVDAAHPEHLELLQEWLQDVLQAGGNSSTSAALLSWNWPSWPPRASAGWAPTPTPMAGGFCVIWRMPDFRDLRGGRARRRARSGRLTRTCSGGVSGDVVKT